MRTAALASGYLIAQGLAGFLWWLLLFLSPAVQDLFFRSPEAWTSGRSIFIADVTMFGALSIAAGVLSLRRHRWATATSWMAVGATSYATLVAAGWLAEPVSHWIGLVLMIPTLLATIASVVLLHPIASAGSRVS